MKQIVDVTFEYGVKVVAFVNAELDADVISDKANELAESDALYYESYEELLEVILNELDVDDVTIIDREEINSYIFDDYVEVDLQYVF